jgi:hypothetical protein
MMTRFIRWWLKGSIYYVQRARDYHRLFDSDVKRDGRSEDYWIGKADGIDATLIHLDLQDLGDATWEKKC